MKATIYFKGVEFEVGFDYQPEEAPERGPYASILAAVNRLMKFGW